jgi:hypothetical protein
MPTAGPWWEAKGPVSLVPSDVTEPHAVNKPRPTRSLADLAQGFLAESFARQGFAQSELVTRWKDIVGPEVAAHAEPLKMRWNRTSDGESAEPATLVLRVEGPVAIEIQHLAGVIIERVNRFFGWQAVSGLRLRQAPLGRKTRKPRPSLDPQATARVAAGLSDIRDERLRDALARLGAAIKQS